MASKAAKHFDRYRAFVKGGWSAILSKNEQAMWHAYNQQADGRTGEVVMRAETLAEILGHKSITHIGEIRERLVARGLIEVLERGGHNGRLFTVRMLTPPPVPKTPKGSQNGSRVGSRIGNHQHDEGSRIGARRFPNPAREGSRIEGALNKEDQPHDQPLDQPLHAASPRSENADDRDDRVAPLPDAIPEDDDAQPAMKHTPKLRMSPEQSRTWGEFKVWYSREAWPRTHAGAAYGFDGGRDPRAIHKILSNPNVAWKLETAKAIAMAFADDRSDAYLRNRGHKLFDLADRVDVYAVRLKQGISHARRPTAAARGEYASSLPTGSRKLAGADAGRASPGNVVSRLHTAADVGAAGLVSGGDATGAGGRVGKVRAVV